MGFTSNRIVSAASARSTSMEQFLIDRRLSISGAGVAVNKRTVAGIPAFDRAVTIAASSVAQCNLRVWRGEEGSRRRVTDSWQSRLLRGAPNPTQDKFTFWYFVESSLTARRNAYIWKTRGVNGTILALTALHPDQVQYHDWDRIPRFTVSFLPGYPAPPEVDGIGSLTVDGSSVRHIRGPGGVGQTIAPSPIEEFALSLGVAIAKQVHEQSLYRNGAQGGLAVTFPTGVSKDQADEWRDEFDSQHAGPGNTARTKVVGNGATITPIGMSQEEAQFVEAVGLSIVDVSLITGVPDWLLGAKAVNSKPISPEHEMQRWLYTGVGPRLSRIESALAADPDLFGPGGDYPAFDTSDLIRGDLTTEDTIAHNQVQSGRLLVDEWREEHGRGPLPGGLGKIPQVVPVGGAPNPVTPVVQQYEDDDEE